MLSSMIAVFFFLYKAEKWPKLQCCVQFKLASRLSVNKHVHYHCKFSQIFFKSKGYKMSCTSKIRLISNKRLTVKYSLQNSTLEDF